MIKKTLVVILSIIILLAMAIGVLVVLNKLNTRDITLVEYETGKEVHADINSDHIENILKISSTSPKLKRDEDGLIPLEEILNYSEKFRISIDNTAFDFETAKGEAVLPIYSLGDINGDGIMEIFVGIYKVSDTNRFPYWMIYTYDENNELYLLTAVPSGRIQYNSFSNRIVVTYTVTDTVIPVTETLEFDF